MDWSRHHPVARERFGLSRLAAASGVEISRIQTWHHRGVVKVRRIGRGKVRRYDLFDALQLAIVAEMSRLGLSISGAGATLSDALVGFLRFEIASSGALGNVGSVALIPVPGADDFFLNRQPARAAVDSCVVIGLRRIAEGVIERYQAG